MIQINQQQLRETLAEQAWRLNNLYFFMDKDGNHRRFSMNWAQQELFDGLHTNNLIIKVRQLGMSTFINLLMLDTSLFIPNTTCGVIAHNEASAKELFLRNIKYPYKYLPDIIKNMCTTNSDSVHGYKFSNNSSIRVATSMRSGVMQILHISEFGKICAQFPARAREIVTGSLETVGAGNLIFIESTAEGNDGYFYDYTQTARALRDSGKTLSKSDYKLFFMPWMKEPSYQQKEPEIFGEKLKTYFDELENALGINLTQEQKNWYAAKRKKLGADCYREYPSTLDEAFLLSLEGTYYTKQLAEARIAKRIGFFPPDSRAPINTFWDLGISDYTAIWFHQLINQQHRFFYYIEEQGEPAQYYVNQVKAWEKKGFTLGTHYMPWDAGTRDKKDGETYADAVSKLGLSPVEIVRTSNLIGGIQQTRSAISAAVFDEEGCEIGLKRLSAYRKEFSERTQTFSDRPLHDEASHGADAFRLWAQGYKPHEPRKHPAAHKMYSVFDRVAGY